MVKIWAVLVSYHPEEAQLRCHLEHVCKQVDSVVLVDNGGSQKFSGQVPTAYVDMQGNKGIAAAQNKGIAYARDHGATHVLFLDQDTLLPPDYVATSLQHLQALEQKGLSVAAIGAHYVSAAAEPSAVVQAACIEKPFIIASGQLTPVSVFDEVGAMNESLFIDAVDDEWCARARAKGFGLYVNQSVCVQHELGEGRPVLCGLRHLRIHKPFRYYTMFRNYRYLIRQPYVPFGLKWHYRWRLCKLLIKALLMPERLAYLAQIMRGCKDVGLVKKVF
jgi:rhamnosyltransferase